MCNSCNIENENRKNGDKGEPTEIAIVKKAVEQGKNKGELYEKMPKSK